MSVTSETDGPKGLFRKSALDKAGAAAIENVDLGVHVVRAPQWLMLAAACAVALAAVGLSLHLPVPSKVAAQGILITAQGLKDIESAAAGRVAAVFVAPGDFVMRGQKVAQIEQPDLDQALEQAQDKMANLRNRHKRIVGFHDRTRSDYEGMTAQRRAELENMIEYDKQHVEWLRTNLEGYERLSEQGLTSKMKLMDARVRLNEAEEALLRDTNALASLGYESNTRQIEQEREILSLDVAIEEARREVSALRERRQRMAYLESAYDGVVVEQKLNVGELVDPGMSVLSILPGVSQKEVAGKQANIPLVATLYISSSEGKKVQPGMAVQIVPSTVKREVYGFIHGTITDVATVASTEEGMMRNLKNRQLVQDLSAQGAPFAATAQLEVSPETISGYRWSSSDGPDQTIGPGSMAQAEIITKEQRLISLVMPALRRLFSDFTS
jgi:HlyD family secretion protein